MKEENKINNVTPAEKKKQFFSMSINENSTIAILSPFLEDKSINAGFSRKDKDFFVRTQTSFSEITNRLNTQIPIQMQFRLNATRFLNILGAQS